MQIVTWVRDKGGLVKVSRSGEQLTGISLEQMQEMEFPADEVCPREFAAKLKRLYKKEENKRGETSYRLLSHPCMRAKNGMYPVCAFLVFQRENGKWIRTVGHLFLLAPTWWIELSACCKRIVERFALLLSAATGKAA